MKQTSSGGQQKRLLLAIVVIVVVVFWSNQFRRSNRARVYVMLIGSSPFASAWGTCCSGRHRWKRKKTRLLATF